MLAPSRRQVTKNVHTMDLALIIIALLSVGLTVLFFVQRRRTQREMDELKAQVEKQNASQSQIIHTTKLASLGQMVAGVAHEMNTPLGFVRSNVEVVGEMLEEYAAAANGMAQSIDQVVRAADMPSFKLARQAAFDARQAFSNNQSLKDSRELLRDAYDGLTQLSTLVVNLKGFSRVDRDGMDSVDLNECVESALMIAGHQLRDRITVVKQLGDLPKVKCVPSQINQVFLNLITNAGQAMADEGTLKITSARNSNRVEVSFSDSGHGIPADILPKIFDPFFTTKPVGEGTGLGLSIVHKIIKSHGGDIKVSSLPNQGATFVVSFPVPA
jgi:two-component system, NtrC family, sensor kinase